MAGIVQYVSVQRYVSAQMVIAGDGGPSPYGSQFCSSIRFRGGVHSNFYTGVPLSPLSHPQFYRNCYTGGVPVSPLSCPEFYPNGYTGRVPEEDSEEDVQGDSTENNKALEICSKFLGNFNQFLEEKCSEFLDNFNQFLYKALEEWCKFLDNLEFLDNFPEECCEFLKECGKFLDEKCSKFFDNSIQFLRNVNRILGPLPRSRDDYNYYDLDDVSRSRLLCGSIRKGTGGNYGEDSEAEELVQEISDVVQKFCNTPRRRRKRLEQQVELEAAVIIRTTERRYYFTTHS